MQEFLWLTPELKNARIWAQYIDPPSPLPIAPPLLHPHSQCSWSTNSAQARSHSKRDTLPNAPTAQAQIKNPLRSYMTRAHYPRQEHKTGFASYYGLRAAGLAGSHISSSFLS